MREQVRTRHYAMTVHAEDEMDEENLSIYDVESVILTGRIIETQRDRVTLERKYIVSGQTLSNDAVTVVAKFSAAGKVFIITVFRE
ncbi:MAG: DUF4258 domain-containing protein [Candidatus Hydrogenedentes bacterium]|nr:DUF4258 domain-containing protein [Candidatus Hydrogenedentota bacterium]